MTTDDVKVTLATALVTATAVVGLWQIPTAVATQDAASPKNEATLDTDEVRISLRLNESTYKAGDKPVVLVKATNRADCAKSVDLKLDMTSTRPSSPMSRMVALPMPAWNKPCMIALGPGETKTVELRTDMAAAAGNVLQLLARAGDKATALSATVAGADGKMPAEIAGPQLQLLTPVQLPQPKDA